MITPEMFAELNQEGFAEEIGLGSRTKNPLLDCLTKDELDLFYFLGSYAWCGTNWEEQERGRVKLILRARIPAKKPNFIKKIFPFL